MNDDNITSDCIYEGVTDGECEIVAADSICEKE